MRARGYIAVLLALAGMMVPVRARAGGVTLIAHGFELESSFPTWVAAMADAIPTHPNFAGANFSTYRIVLTYSDAYYFTISRVNGSAPAATDSGEIFIELDWSALSGDLFDSYADTTEVAGALTQLMLLTNLTSELGGHALGEFPLHLIGHSRGGSLVADLSRQLGLNGVWVDQVTSLDPYPINNDGNFDFPASITDATAKDTYANVLFADNYWQDLGAGIYTGDPDGEAVNGAYVRQLTDLTGGYGNGEDHSNVHLWYHGTVSLVTPTSDTSASITSSEREAWWTAYEEQGTNAGFEYSLIAGGNRMSTNQPTGVGQPAIVNGFNQWWNLGAGTDANRTALASNNGDWPDLIRFDVLQTNPVVQGQGIQLGFYYQWAQPAASNATMTVYLDSDANPLDTNQIFLDATNLPGTGASSVGLGAITILLTATNASPGTHRVFAVISGGGRQRYLYAPEQVEVLSIHQPPVLGISSITSSGFVIGISGLAGQTAVLQSSADLNTWEPLATNHFPTNATWFHTNSGAATMNQLFFRAQLAN
jgi:hypothetical protein